MTERCKTLDADGCRCLRPAHDEKTPHDWSYTPWVEAQSVRYRHALLQPLSSIIRKEAGR